MVVWLKGYIEGKYCPGGASRVNMINEIKKQVRSSPATKVIIAVDMGSSLYMISSQISEVLSGGRHTLFRDRLRHLFQGLVNAGATLVFFAEGPVKELKLRSWANRANESYDLYQYVFQANNASEEIDWDRMKDNRSIYYNTYLQTAKEFGEVRVAFENECDSLVANYASEAKAFAVIAGDTDYLIFSGDWRVWRIESSHATYFSAIEWNKANLRSNLMLEQKHLPIFATLCGNDFMPAACVQHLKHSLVEGGFQKRLAELIRRTCLNGIPLSDGNKDALIELIFSDMNATYSKTEISKFLDDSINFYCSRPSGAGTIEPIWLKNHALQTQTTILYIIMKNLPFVLFQPYIDPRQQNVKQFFELALPIFQRQIGIVLRDANDNHTHVVYYKPNHDEPFQRKTVNAVKPTIALPPIRDVLTNPQMKHSKKLDILAELLFPGNLRVRKRLENLKARNVNFIPILKICYLKENNQITREEADILLLSVHESCTLDNKHRQMCEAPKIFNSRAFWIAMTYNNLGFFFVNSLTLSGLNDFITVDTFDGYIFHNLYAKFSHLGKDERDRLLESVKNIRIYVG